MVQSFTDDFHVTWADPADASQSWTMDPMHFPRPMPPLTFEFLKRVETDIFGARVICVNGYRYALNSMPPPPTPEIMQKGPLRVWRDDYVPRISEVCETMRSRDYEAMDAVDLADMLEGIIADSVEAFRYTMVMVFAFMGPTMELVAFTERELGPDGPQLLGTLLQGFENGSSAAGEGLNDLTELAASHPAVAAALREGRYADLPAVDGGPEFLAKLDAYLNEFGWRAESWALPHVPTWAETPAVPMGLIARYLGDDSISPGAAIERSRRQRESVMQTIEGLLKGETLEEFKQRLTGCEIHVPISEGRAQWQLTIVGSIRVPALALGKKLVDAGVLDEANDVFFLTLAELKDAARNRLPLRALVATRRADLERQELMSPPPFLGTPPAEPPAAVAAIVKNFWGYGVEPSTDAMVITGNGASKGVVRGRARIIRDLSEADRLQKGDILVCPSTAPPWTPLFAIAGAVVTDTGGILSHSAICAREYGVPCVAGTQVGTRQIPDGAMVTVDGGAGTVRVEG